AMRAQERRTVMKLRVAIPVIVTLAAVVFGNTIPAAAAPGSQTTAAASAAATCVPAPAGLVSWWAANGSAVDAIGSNNGIQETGAGFAPARVADGFSLEGSDDYVPAARSKLLAPPNPCDSYAPMSQTPPSATSSGRGCPR